MVSMLTDQGRAALKAAFSYAKQYGAWGSGQDIARAIRRDRRNAQRLMRKLEAGGYVTMRWKGPESGWILTAAGLAAIGHAQAPPMKAGVARRRIRNNPGKHKWHTRRKRLEQRFQTLSELAPVEY